MRAPGNGLAAGTGLSFWKVGPPAFVLVLLGVACYLRIGYAYGSGDHEEILPMVLRALDPSLFPRDLFLLEEQEHFSVRAGFVVLMQLVSLVLPPPVAFFVVGMAAWLATIWALWRVAFLLVPSRGAATLAVLALLATTPRMLGGLEFFFSMLVPGSLAWPFALLALEAFARRRLYLAAGLLGVGTWFHPLIGLQVGLLLGLVALWQMADGRPREALLRALGFGALYAAVAAPILLPSILTQTSGAPVPDDGFSTYYVIARLRYPHHHLLFSQPPVAFLQFGLIVAAGLGGLAWLRRRGGLPSLQHVRFALRLLTVIAVLVTFYVVMTEGAESAFVVRMQFLRYTALAAFVLLAWACGALVAALPTRWRMTTEGLFDRRALGWSAAAAVLGATVALASLGIGRPAAKWEPGVYARTDLARAEVWAREETPRDALFLVPPSTTTFRSNALRSIVFDRLSTPFRDDAVHGWFARLRTVAPVPLPERAGPDWTAAIDSAYHAHSPAGWAALADRFGADYALVDLRATPTPPAGEPAFRAGSWAMYRLADDER